MAPGSPDPVAPPYDGLMVKRIYEHPGTFATVGGARIPLVRVGFETAGQLNAAGDNAILIPHFFTGNSHFAGRYRAEEPLPGYWDALVGPGRPLDTDRYLLVGVDTLANVRSLDGVTVTTGPASLDPATGRPYGMRFPQIQIRDQVEIQKAVLRSLGVRRLHAVVGASMGSMQAFEWAASSPEWVDRIVAVVPSAQTDALSLLRLRDMCAAIKLDPAWAGGDYYGTPGPVQGLSLALSMMNALSLAPPFCDATFGRRWADPAQDPARDMAHGYAAQAYMAATVAASVALGDANSFLYTARANELFSVGGESALEDGLKKIKAKVLLVPSVNDQMLPPGPIRKVRDLLQAQGNAVDYFELTGPCGHLDGALGIGQAAEAIAGFLGKP